IDGLAGYHLGELAPVGFRERLHGDADLIRSRAGALHLRRHSARLDRDREHLPGPRIAAPSREPRSQVEALEEADPLPGPPALPKFSALGLSANSSFRGPGPRGPDVAPPMPVAHVSPLLPLLSHGLLSQSKQVLQIGVRKLGEPAFAGPHHASR